MSHFRFAGQPFQNNWSASSNRRRELLVVIITYRSAGLGIDDVYAGLTGYRRIAIIVTPLRVSVAPSFRYRGADSPMLAPWASNHQIWKKTSRGSFFLRCCGGGDCRCADTSGRAITSFIAFEGTSVDKSRALLAIECQPGDLSIPETRCTVLPSLSRTSWRDWIGTVWKWRHRAQPGHYLLAKLDR